MPPTIPTLRDMEVARLAFHYKKNPIVISMNSGQQQPFHRDAGHHPEVPQAPHGPPAPVHHHGSRHRVRDPLRRKVRTQIRISQKIIGANSRLASKTTDVNWTKKDIEDQYGYYTNRLTNRNICECRALFKCSIAGNSNGSTPVELTTATSLTRGRPPTTGTRQPI